jgi:hypothetical protein
LFCSMGDPRILLIQVNIDRSQRRTGFAVRETLFVIDERVTFLSDETSS